MQTVLVQKQKDKPLCVLCDELLPQTTTRPSEGIMTIIIYKTTS